MNLYPYQQKILDRALKFNSYALFMDCRTGKTPIAIEWMKAKDNGCNLSWLVVCRVSVIETVWEVHLRKWWPRCRIDNLRKTDEMDIPTQLSELNKPVVSIINYESYKKLIHPEFDGIVLDESQKIKDPRTSISKALRKIAYETQYKLVMTGTPAPNTPLEYWPQMNFVNQDILNSNFYRFRGSYFYNPHAYIWVCPPAKRTEIMKKIRKQAVFMPYEEVAKLPHNTPPLIKTFELDKPSAKLYKDLVKNYIAKFKNHAVIAESELVEIMKLRQITSGFFIDNTGNTIKFSDSKLKLLDETVSEINDAQAIIWCQFREEIKQVSRILGLSKCSILQGGLSDVERTRSINEFSDGTRTYLVAHPRSASLGLDFSNCCYSIGYSLSYSLEEEYQSGMRIKGIKKTKKNFFIYLMARNTIDEVIYKALKRKANLSSELLAMLKARA